MSRYWKHVGLIVGTVLLVVIMASLVAWGAVRVRPLELLRDEFSPH